MRRLIDFGSGPYVFGSVIFVSVISILFKINLKNLMDELESKYDQLKSDYSKEKQDLEQKLAKNESLISELNEKIVNKSFFMQFY